MKRKNLCVTLVLMICLLAAVPTLADAKPCEEMRSTTTFSAGHSQNNDGSTHYWGRIIYSLSANLTITVNLKNANGIIISSATNVKTSNIINAGASEFLPSGTYTIEINGTINGAPVTDPTPTQFTI